MTRAMVAVAFSCFLLSAASTAHAQTGNGYDLTWSTIDGGGETFSTGGDYELGSTIGQPDAGEVAGGEYVLTGGFWFAGPETTPPQGVPTVSEWGMAIALLLMVVAGVIVIGRRRMAAT